MTTLTTQQVSCIAANLRRSQPKNPGSKLGYHTAITAVANALQQIDPEFDRAAFMKIIVAQPGEQVALPVPELQS